MAFTPEQEAILLQIISAYENGKRLADLPVEQVDNPFDLWTEVIGTDGESKKAALAELLPYVEEECMYGVEWDASSSNPDVTRIGNMNLHVSLPIQNRMHGCLLDDNGHVVEYLNPNSWEEDVLDGTRGQVMVELPAFYWKFEEQGNIRRVKLSEYPLPGYTFVKKKYVSAYEATVDRATSSLKLCSVKNDSEQYRGCGNQSAWDGTYRSALGRPATSISLTDFRTYARRRNGDATTEWNCNTYDIQKELYWLFVVEYATRNSQKAFNAELTEAGYKQGGLGNGVLCDGTLWNNLNGYYPFVPCGYTDDLGNFSGEKSYVQLDENGNTLFTVTANRYRGIEQPFAHIWKWTDGIHVMVSANEENGGDGTSKIYVTDDPSLFNDSNNTGYAHVGNEDRASDWIKDVVFGNDGEIMAHTHGGGSSSYFCDYHYVSIPSSGTSLRGVLFGGVADVGARCGFVYSFSTSAPSNTNTNVGSRLCFIPA